jgi:hypothetical protein
MKMIQKLVPRRPLQLNALSSLLLQYLLGVCIGIIPLLMGLFFLNGGFISRGFYIGTNAATCLLALMLYMGDFLCATFFLRHRTLRYTGVAIIVTLVVIPVFLLFFFTVMHTPGG